MEKKVIEQLGLEQEVRSLYKSGLSGKDIRERIIQNHPEIPNPPSIASIYKFLREYSEPRPKEFTKHFTWDFEKMMGETSSYISEANANCRIEKRKDFGIRSKDFLGIFGEFCDKYEDDERNYEQLFRKFNNEIVCGLCPSCQTWARPKAIEILNTFKAKEE